MVDTVWGEGGGSGQLFSLTTQEPIVIAGGSGGVPSQLEVKVGSFKHSCDSVEHYTPSKYIEAAREVMGSIDLDPCSSDKANEVVKATEHIDSRRNGLDDHWFTGSKEYLWTSNNIWLNPPSPPKAWWNKLMTERDLGHVNQAVYLAYNLQQLQSLQRSVVRSVGSFTICIPDHRIQFLHPDTLEPQGSPKYPNAFVYVPGVSDNSDRFTQVFSTFGACFEPCF